MTAVGNPMASALEKSMNINDSTGSCILTWLVYSVSARQCQKVLHSRMVAVTVAMSSKSWTRREWRMQPRCRQYPVVLFLLQQQLHPLLQVKLQKTVAVSSCTWMWKAKDMNWHHWWRGKTLLSNYRQPMNAPNAFCQCIYITCILFYMQSKGYLLHFKASIII